MAWYRPIKYLLFLVFIVNLMQMVIAKDVHSAVFIWLQYLANDLKLLK